MFGAQKKGGLQVSVSSLTLGTLYEAILAFSSQDSFETFWPSVCQNARWLIPSQRMCTLLCDGEDSFTITGLFAQGQFRQPSMQPYKPGKTELDQALHRNNAQWFVRPQDQFHATADELAEFLFESGPELLFVLPMRIRGENIGAILFVMGEITEVDQAMLNTLGTIYAQHAAMTYTLISVTEERRQMQHQLTMQEKMAALGNLVAGVAHEINNPIGAVNSAADVSARCIEVIGEAIAGSATLDDLKNDRKFEKALKLLRDNNQVIVTAGQRIGGIVQNLKNFARLDEAQFKTADIHEGIDSTLMLVDHELKSRIEVVKEYGDIPYINCFPNQLNQVLMNLLINAAHAIEGKGEIHISTWADAECIYLKIADTGKGIAPDKIGQIFEPGFTTKGVGVGTGLGLSISYNIIEKHRGTIEVQSTVGEGTEFTITLPVEGAAV